ncbi:serine/threonine protein phosphatase, putative [Trypanosoma cruzi]|nr:serine/threonine protein phosphatase, putative [Trypanosoma cruzi]
MRHCGKPKCFVMRMAFTHPWGRTRIGHAVRLPGVQVDHTHRAVSLSEKFVLFVCAMPALNSSTIAGMEVVASRFLYAAAILGTRLCDYYSFINAVRRRLSVLHQGIVQETSPANLPPSVVGLGERLRHIIEYNRRRIIKPTEKASAAIIVDASLHGWRAVFIPDSGDVKIAGGKWKRKPFLIMQAEARGTLSLIGLFRHLAIHHGHLGGQHFAARSGE